MRKGLGSGAVEASDAEASTAAAEAAHATNIAKIRAMASRRQQNLPTALLSCMLAGRIGLLTAASVCTRRTAYALTSMADASRDRMMNEIGSGGETCADGDASSKIVLIRGCDPVMAQRAGQMLPPMLGNAKITSSTNDDDFFLKLEERKWDVVMFAPGACRFSAARQQIPGGNDRTRMWTLEDYRVAVREKQGDAVPIVETTEERLIVPKLRESLGLPPQCVQ